MQDMARNFSLKRSNKKKKELKLSTGCEETAVLTSKTSMYRVAEITVSVSAARDNYTAQAD